MPTYPCPKGHQSTEPDYCSECGAKMQAAALLAEPVPVTPQAIAGPEHCPDCGTARDQPDIAFCEICGYNFITGAHGDLSAIPPAPAPEPGLEEAPETDQHPTNAAPAWTATLAIDPALQEPGSPVPPEGIGPFSFALTAPVSLIGRRSEPRAIFPEVPVQHDDAVSHRHALLQLDAAAGTLTVRDIGSSNGTRLNGVALKPMTDYPLNDGDVLAFGHWSVLTLSLCPPRGTSTLAEA